MVMLLLVLELLMVKKMSYMSTSGKIIRFAESDARAMGRVSQGVKGITIGDNEEKSLVWRLLMMVLKFLSVTDKGYGKRSSATEYRKQSRGGKGIIAMKLTRKLVNCSN
jgi:DNA gyrase subunit A